MSRKWLKVKVREIALNVDTALDKLPLILWYVCTVPTRQKSYSADDTFENVNYTLPNKNCHMKHTLVLM